MSCIFSVQSENRTMIIQIEDYTRFGRLRTVLAEHKTRKVTRVLMYLAKHVKKPKSCVMLQMHLFGELSMERHYKLRLKAGSVRSAGLVIEASDIRGGQAQKIFKIFYDLNFVRIATAQCQSTGRNIIGSTDCVVINGLEVWKSSISSI